MSDIIDFNNFTACFKSYVPYVKSRVMVFCHNMDEFDDYLQEGLLGLLQAVETYDKTKGVAFLTYAKVCIDHRLTNFVRKSSGKNKVPKKYILGFDSITNIKTEDTPENIVIDKDEVEFLKQKAKFHLSKMEYKVFVYYICGYSYSEISAKLNVPVKSVDNAINRIKTKLKK